MGSDSKYFRLCPHPVSGNCSTLHCRESNHVQNVIEQVLIKFMDTEIETSYIFHGMKSWFFFFLQTLNVKTTLSSRPMGKEAIRTIICGPVPEAPPQVSPRTAICGSLLLWAGLCGLPWEHVRTWAKRIPVCSLLRWGEEFLLEGIWKQGSQLHKMSCPRNPKL